MSTDPKPHIKIATWQHWLSTVWLGFVVVQYGDTALKTVREPFNPGWDLGWATAWIAFLIAVMVLSALLRRSVVNLLGFGLAGVLTLTILVLSHTVLAAVTALAILVVAAGLGELVLQRLGLLSTTLSERLVLTVPIGIGALALSQLLLGVFGLFNPVVSWSLMFACGFPSLLGLRRLLIRRPEKGIEKHPLAIAPLAYVFLLNLTWATAPEIQYDALSAHLAVPRLQLQYGALVDLPYFFHSYFAHLMDMIFGLCLALGGQLVAKFLVLGLGVLAAAGVYVIGRTLFSEDVGLWASIIFYTTPLVVWLSATTYLDLTLALFIVASVIAFIRWYESGSPGWLAASGWIAGVAIGTKIAALEVLLVFPVFAVWHDRRLRSLALFLIPLLIVAVPWFLIIYLHTGNPFFPFLNAVFRSPLWPLENTTLNSQDFGVGTSASALLRLPFRFTFDSTLFGEGLARGGAGVALLLAFPLSLPFFFRGGALRRTLMIALALHLTIWTTTFQYGRYIMPALPFLAVMGCAVFLHQSAGLAQWNRVLLFCCVSAQVLVAPVLFWNLPERFPVQRAFGLESEETFLERNLPPYRAAHFLNGVLQPGDKILGVGVEDMRFYLNGPLYTQTEINLDLPPYELGERRFGTDRELAAWHMRHQFVYLFILKTALKDPAPWFPFLQPNFLQRYGTELYSDEKAAVFRVSPPE